jgi:hypothetical protein
MLGRHLPSSFPKAEAAITAVLANGWDEIGRRAANVSRVRNDSFPPSSQRHGQSERRTQTSR